MNFGLTDSAGKKSRHEAVRGFGRSIFMSRPEDICQNFLQPCKCEATSVTKVYTGVKTLLKILL